MEEKKFEKDEFELFHEVRGRTKGGEKCVSSE